MSDASIEGARVGTSEASMVGARVGVIEGRVEFIREGDPDGAKDGAVEGTTDWLTEGETEGTAESRREGDIEGNLDGNWVPIILGNELDNSVGASESVMVGDVEGFEDIEGTSESIFVGTDVLGNDVVGNTDGKSDEKIVGTTEGVSEGWSLSRTVGAKIDSFGTMLGALEGNESLMSVSALSRATHTPAKLAFPSLISEISKSRGM